MNFSPDESLTDEGNIPRDKFETILAQIVEAAERGEPVDLDAWLPGDPAAQQRAWELIGKVRALAGLGRRYGTLSHPEELCGRRLDEYQIQDEIGRGGFGVVYRGVHVKLGQRVAIKCLRRELLLDPHFRQRQQREMEILGGLEHKNILRPLDARVADGIPLIVTEFVEGENLASLVERAGKLSLAETCEIARQVADGLDYAHQHDVVHRDVKPHNIIYNEKSGLVKILDFGLSRLTCGHSTLDASLTSESMYVGAPAYTAPEQWIRASDVTGNADVYALGCVIYYCLHGRAMYEGDSHMELAFEHCHGPTPELGNVPEDLRRLWRRMVSKNPDDRPSASSVSRFLVNLCAGNLASVLPRLIEQLEEPHVCGLLRDEMSLVKTHLCRLTPLRAMSLFRDAGSLLTAKRGMSGEERALCALVFACLEIERHDLAFQIGKRVIEQVPNCSEVCHYTAVAAIHYRAESPEEGEEYLREAVRLEENVQRTPGRGHDTVSKPSLSTLAQAYHELCRLQRRRGEVTLAKDFLDKALHAYEQRLRGCRAALPYALYAQALTDAERYEEALEAAETACVLEWFIREGQQLVIEFSERDLVPQLSRRDEHFRRWSLVAMEWPDTRERVVALRSYLSYLKRAHLLPELLCRIEELPLGDIASLRNQCTAAALPPIETFITDGRYRYTLAMKRWSFPEPPVKAVVVGLPSLRLFGTGATFEQAEAYFTDLFTSLGEKLRAAAWRLSPELTAACKWLEEHKY